MTSNSKEQKLIEKIEKAKQELANLREQRKQDIGQLAYQCGIADLSNDILKEAFMALAIAQSRAPAQERTAVSANAATHNA